MIKIKQSWNGKPHPVLPSSIVGLGIAQVIDLWNWTGIANVKGKYVPACLDLETNTQRIGKSIGACPEGREGMRVVNDQVHVFAYL